MTHSLSVPAVLPSPVPLLRASEIPHPELALARGELAHVRRGVYAPHEQWAGLPPWERYLARVHAVAICIPDVVFCAESAAALRGLPVFGHPREVHVLRDDGADAGVTGDLRIHTASGPREIADLGGYAVTDDGDTAVDLARHRHPAIGLAVADAALRRDPALSVENLVARNEARASSRGRRRARWSLHRANGDAETTLESISRAAIAWLGFPEPELQRWFTACDGHRDRADMWWPTEQVIGEADGDLKYDGRFGDPVAAMRERRRRDARLRDHVRSVAHWAWDEVTEFTRLRSILLGAGLRRIQPEDTARLLELRRLLAPLSPSPSPYPRDQSAPPRPAV
ncbi:hypothetical protein [Microbacterium sp. SORGH_AS_0888]|uniref:hypothetical protein n=1 Tax=Microbacterium sp. SORGH_AS_0888 TaxID=3041791 RepID=UPI0027D88C06|nr:hypothetical protein [Microbacterium sp. SORGH_AS_0888]